MIDEDNRCSRAFERGDGALQRPQHFPGARVHHDDHVDFRQLLAVLVDVDLVAGVDQLKLFRRRASVPDHRTLAHFTQVAVKRHFGAQAVAVRKDVRGDEEVLVLPNEFGDGFHGCSQGGWSFIITCRWKAGHYRCDHWGRTFENQGSALPVTPAEQGAAAAEAVLAGASVIHLHVRTTKGIRARSSRIFAARSKPIRAAAKPVPTCSFSTGGAVGEDMARRIAPLTLRPEMASFNLGTINFGDEIFANTFPDMRQLAAAMQSNGVIPEFEVYDLGHLDNLRKLEKEGVLKPPYHCQFVLGVPGGLSGDVEALVALVQRLPRGASWALPASGDSNSRSRRRRS